MIENMSLYTHGLDIGLDFSHMWTEPSCQNNNNILLFYFLSQEVCIQQLLTEKVCLFSNVYFHSSSFMKNNFSFLRNSSRDKIFCSFI